MRSHPGVRWRNQAGRFEPLPLRLPLAEVEIEAAPVNEPRFLDRRLENALDPETVCWSYRFVSAIQFIFNGPLPHHSPQNANHRRIGQNIFDPRSLDFPESRPETRTL